MSAERKIQRAQSGVRRKNSANTMDFSRSTSAGTLLTHPASSSNDIDNLKHLLEPSKKEAKPLSRTSSSSSMLRQKKHSDAALKPLPLIHSKSVDSSYSSLSSGSIISVNNVQINKDSMEYFFSSEREVTIEEEQHAKILQLYQLVMVWKRRWRELRDENDLIRERLKAIEIEYNGICAVLKDSYEQKLFKVKEDMKKMSKSRDELHKEKRSLETSFKHMLEHSKRVKKELEDKIAKQTNDIENLKDSLLERNCKIDVLKKQVEEYTKKDANTNRVTEQNRTLMSENKSLLTKVRSMEILLKEANLRDENYEIIVDTSINMLRQEETTHKLTKMSKLKRWRPHTGRYVLNVDPSDPAKMHISEVEKIRPFKLDTQSLHSLDSLDSLNNDETMSLLNVGLVSTPATMLDSNKNQIPYHYKQSIGLSDSLNSGISLDSIAGRSLPSTAGSIGSTPSVFSDCQSPVFNTQGESNPQGNRSKESIKKHKPLQKSLTADVGKEVHGDITMSSVDKSLDSTDSNTSRPKDITYLVHSVPDLRSCTKADILMSQQCSESQLKLPAVEGASVILADDDTYTHHVRKGSMDSDLLLSDTRKKKKKSNHQRRKSLDFDMLTAEEIRKTPKPSRFDFLNRHKNGVVDEEGKVKDKSNRKSKASEFADMLRKLTTSSSNLHDVDKKSKKSTTSTSSSNTNDAEKKSKKSSIGSVSSSNLQEMDKKSGQNGLSKKRKARSLKDKDRHKVVQDL